MKKGTLIAAVVTPIVAGGAGVMIAQYTNANAANPTGYCAEPTVYVDMAEGVSMITGGANSNCEAGSCTVSGLAQVEVNADGRVQCVDVNDGQTLTVSRRGEDLSVLIEEFASR
jgi:hypothetical protein